jgi:hypothetical protein
LSPDDQAGFDDRSATRDGSLESAENHRDNMWSHVDFIYHELKDDQDTSFDVPSGHSLIIEEVKNVELEKVRDHLLDRFAAAPES